MTTTREEDNDEDEEKSKAWDKGDEDEMKKNNLLR